MPGAGLALFAAAALCEIGGCSAYRDGPADKTDKAERIRNNVRAMNPPRSKSSYRHFPPPWRYTPVLNGVKSVPLSKISMPSRRFRKPTTT